MEEQTNAEITCKKCGKSSPGEALFCASCGKRLSGSATLVQISFRPVLIASIGGLALWAAIWFNQYHLLGVPPTERYVPPPANHPTADYNDPDIERLRKATTASPDDPRVWKALAKEISLKVRAGVIPPRLGALEIVEALGKALRINPNDYEAMLLMADVAFEQKAFTKAAEFYARYLEALPGEISVRAKYASTLTFLGKIDQAIQILREVLEEAPNDFQALAFLSIALTQKGEIEEAQRLGERALAHAPSEDARARFSTFLNSFEVQSSDTSPPQPNSPGAKLASHLRANEKIGEKLIAYDFTGGIFQARLVQFPMDKMPPFAKEKFFGGLKSFVESEGLEEIKEIVFVDQGSGKVMDTLTIKEST